MRPGGLCQLGVDSISKYEKKKFCYYFDFEAIKKLAFK
jgi:hypothetical protein